VGGDLTAAVDRPAEGVHHAADQRRPHRDLEHAAGAPDLVALLELEVVAEHHGADVVLLEVERQGGDRLARLARMDLEHLPRHRLAEAVDARDAVLDLQDGADFLDVELVEVGGLDLLEENVLDLAGAERGFGCHTMVGKERRVGSESSL
jgi:hypothetical protein